MRSPPQWASARFRGARDSRCAPRLVVENPERLVTVQQSSSGLRSHGSKDSGHQARLAGVDGRAAICALPSLSKSQSGFAVRLSLEGVGVAELEEERAA